MALRVQQRPALLRVRPQIPQHGLLGAWYADQIDPTVRYIPNAVASRPVSANRARAPRRLFNNTSFWGKTSATITDDYTTAPDGSSEASRLLSTANNWLLVSPGAGIGTFPAGTYTCGVNVKSNTGGSQTFRLSMDGGSNNSTVQTATTSWQRFSFTYTFVSSQNIKLTLLNPDGATSGDIVFCDFELYEGSSDLGPTTPDSHWYLGLSTKTTQPTYASGLLDCSANGFGLVQLPTAITLDTTNKFTAICLASKTGSNNYSATFTKAQTATDFYLSIDQTGVPLDFKGAAIEGANASPLWVLLNKGLHAFTQRWDGTDRELWIDDVRLFRKTSAISSATFRDLAQNLYGGGGGLKFHAIALYNRALTDAEVRQAVYALQSRAAGASLSATNISRIYVAEGDSITTGSTAYPYVFGPNASPAVIGADYAVSAARLNNNAGNSLDERKAKIDAILPIDRTGRTFILSVLIGANDLAGYTGGAAQYLTDYAAYCDARRAAGWKVVVCTILPISGNATHNSRRATVNSAITSSWTGLHCDGVADFAADAIMGTDTSFTDSPSYWADGTHPNSSGHVRLEAIIRPVINAL